MRKALLLRFLFGLVVGILVAIPFTELTFRWQGNNTSRPPKTVEIDIPAGAHEKVDAGQSVLPQDIFFVVGDVLLVRNHDSVVHTLGPLVIPPQSSATMSLNKLGDLSFVCSFQPTKYEGLNVTAPLTLGTRLEGIIIAGFPLGMLVALYSLILRPLKKRPDTLAAL
jgi:hypothetical protein